MNITNIEKENKQSKRNNNPKLNRMGEIQGTHLPTTTIKKRNPKETFWNFSYAAWMITYNQKSET